MHSLKICARSGLRKKLDNFTTLVGESFSFIALLFERSSIVLRLSYDLKQASNAVDGQPGSCLPFEIFKNMFNF